MPASRLASAALLAGVLSAAAVGQAPQQPPADPPKDPAKADPMPKEPPKFEWPKEVAGKDVKGHLKDLADPDPSVRDAAVRALPAFGPDARKDAVRPLLARIDSQGKQYERDPSVRLAAVASVAALGVEDPADLKETIRLLSALLDKSEPGGNTRMTAVTALTSFGEKAEPCLTVMTGTRITNDPSWEVRRAVAAALGKIGGDERQGPNVKALAALISGPPPAPALIDDPCAAVRVDAFQSVVVLGNPWAGVKDPKSKTPPPARQPETDRYVGLIKKRLLKEKEKQVEVWGRVALMRLEPKEINDENLTAIARVIADGSFGSKIHALGAFRLLEDKAAKKLTEIIAALKDADPIIASEAVRTLVAIGDAAKPAIPEIEKLKDRPGSEAEKKYFAELVKAAVKVIEEAKPKDGSASPSSTGEPQKP